MVPSAMQDQLFNKCPRNTRFIMQMRWQRGVGSSWDMKLSTYKQDSFTIPHVLVKHSLEHCTEAERTSPVCSSASGFGERSLALARQDSTIWSPDLGKELLAWTEGQQLGCGCYMLPLWCRLTWCSIFCGPGRLCSHTRKHWVLLVAQCCAWNAVPDLAAQY